MAAPLRLAALAALLCLGACASAPAPRPAFTGTAAFEGMRPGSAIELLRDRAIERGFRIADERPDSLVVDFGVRTARVAVAVGSGTEIRETEVHATAVYGARPTTNGATVVMLANPIYWHPDLRCWLPAAADLSPGRELLRIDAAGTQ